MSTQDPATQEAEDSEGQLQAARPKSPEGEPGVDSSSGRDMWMQATVRNAARQVRQVMMGMSDEEILQFAGREGLTSQSSCQPPAAADQGQPPAADQEHLQAEQGQLQAAATAEVESQEEPGMLFPSQSECGFGATVDWGDMRVS